MFVSTFVQILIVAAAPESSVNSLTGVVWQAALASTLQYHTVNMLQQKKIRCPPPLPTPPLELSALCYDVWCRELTGDDHSDNVTLLEGIKHGFHIVDSEVCPEYASMSNYKSATCSDNFAMVQAQIVEELEEGRYIVSLEKPQIVSALGAIPKTSGVCGWFMIVVDLQGLQ